MLGLAAADPEESGGRYFTPAQVTQRHSIALGAAAHHVTIGSSGDNGALSGTDFGEPVKEVSHHGLGFVGPASVVLGGDLRSPPTTGRAEPRDTAVSAT
jgi:hypothetical protein